MCRAFVEYGWCDKGEECRLRHAVECPEFSERGTCGRVGCKLPHILRRRNEDGVEDDEEEDDEEGEGEELAEGEIQWEATKPSKRGRRASDALGGEVELEPGEAQGISGSAGWALKSKKAKRRAHDLDANNDFVTLSIPLEDDDEEDDDEDSDNESVDSADLDDDEGSQLSREGSAPGDHEDVDEQLEAADAPSEASEITLPSASVDVDMPVAVAVESDDSEEDGEGDEEVEKLLRY